MPSKINGSVSATTPTSLSITITPEDEIIDEYAIVVKDENGNIINNLTIPFTSNTTNVVVDNLKSKNDYIVEVNGVKSGVEGPKIILTAATGWSSQNNILFFKSICREIILFYFRCTPSIERIQILSRFYKYKIRP